MRKIILLLIVGFAVSFTACNKIDFNKNNKVNPSDIIVITDKAELQKRITNYNEVVTFNNLKSTSAFTKKFTLKALVTPSTSKEVFHWLRTYDIDGSQSWYNTLTPVIPTEADYTFTPLIPASTKIPVGDFSITGAAMFGTKAYFTSHINGSGIGGEVLVVDFATSPTVEVSIFDFSGDYNDLTIDLDVNGSPAAPKLWVAGDNKKGAMLRYSPLTDIDALYGIGVDDAQDVVGNIYSMTEFPVSPTLGVSGNSVTVQGDSVYFVAGGSAKGSLSVYSKATGTLTGKSADYKFAKHFDLGEMNTGSGLFSAFLYDNTGSFGDDKSTLRVYNSSLNNYLANGVEYDLDYDVTYVGKNGIDIDGDNNNSTEQFAYCAMGGDGIIKVALAPVTYKTVNYPAGAVVDEYQISANAPLDGNGLANSLVVDGIYVYVAYGASGLLVFDKYDLAAGPIGQFNSELLVNNTGTSSPGAYQGSCNYVSVDGAILWVGFGTGGMVKFKMKDI